MAAPLPSNQIAASDRANRIARTEELAKMSDENLIPDREILSACLDLLLQIISYLEGKSRSITLTTTTGKTISVVSSKHSDSGNGCDRQGHIPAILEKTASLLEPRSMQPEEPSEPTATLSGSS